MQTNKQADYWNHLAVTGLDAAVIDPQDRLGQKNAYIAGIRNQAVLESLDSVGKDEPILDFGCGTGGVTALLDAAGWPVIGLDIAAALLSRFRERKVVGDPLVVLFDGALIPISEASLGAVVTYSVLMYLQDDGVLQAMLSDLRRVVRPGGILVLVEQFRRKRREIPEHGKVHRSIREVVDLATSAGWSAGQPTILRHGHFPMLYAIRYGLVPRAAFRAIARLERSMGRICHLIPGDYADVRIVFKNNA